jgi:WD40 repeat protein
MDAYSPVQVNRIRLFSRFPHVLATSSDDELVRVFTTSKADKDPYKPPCEPDLRLVDNQERAPFALATSQIGSSVASGTSTGERVVRVWDIEDHVSAGLVNKRSKGTTEVRARSLFKGHQKEIEDVCFHPNESDKLASVAEDGTLMLYDARKGSSPARAVKFEGHPANLRCVDWNTRDPNHVAIGDADGVLRILDLRNPAKDLIKAHEHSGELLSVRWNPADSKILMTGGEDCFVNLWITRQEASRMPDGSKPIRHKMLLLSYKSNGRVQETVWNPTSAHCVLNVSTGDGEESSSVDNNGTMNNSSSFLEVWRPWDMIFLSETDAIARIRNLWCAKAAVCSQRVSTCRFRSISLWLAAFAVVLTHSAQGQGGDLGSLPL